MLHTYIRLTDGSEVAYAPMRVDGVVLVSVTRTHADGTDLALMTLPAGQWIVNEGFSWPDSRLMRSCIFIGPTTSGAEFLDSFTHELRHLADDIATFLGINLRGEEVAYLTGDTTRDLAEVVCRLGCPDCG